MSRLLRVLVGLLVIGSVLGGAAGAVAAQTTDTATATTTETSTTVDLNQTVEVGNDTQSLYVEASNVSSDLTVTVYGIDSSGTETQTTTDTILTTPDTTLSEYTVNTTKYDSYRVTVTGSAESVDIGQISTVSAIGGGGLFGGDGASGIQIIVIGLVVLGVFVVLVEER